MSDFVDKLRAGTLPTDSDWTNHLLAAHREVPGRTPFAFASLRTPAGQNSYELLADSVDGATRVLDLACGDGHLIPGLLARMGGEGRIVGLDMSAGELERARLRVRDPRVEWKEGRAQDLPFRDGEFDRVVCHLALMLMLPLDPVVREIHRVLKPGGTFSAIVPAPVDDDFLIAVRDLCLEFVNRRVPLRQQARTGDGRVRSAEGLRELFSARNGFDEIHLLKDVHFAATTDPEGVWNLMRGMYFMDLLDASEQEELRPRVLSFATRHARFGRTLRFEFPLRWLAVRRS